MQVEHDKEIEALLKRVAKGDAKASAGGTHLDADEISMFSENAMPDAGRVRAIEHLADCDRCRTILSGVIAMRAEDEPDEAAAPIAVETIVETQPESSWLSKFFATKNLAFGFGALAILFAGFLGFTFISNFQSGGADLAQADKTEMAPARAEQSANANLEDLRSSNEPADSSLAETKEETGVVPVEEGRILAPSPDATTGKDIAVPVKRPTRGGFTDSNRDQYRERNVPVEDDSDRPMAAEQEVLQTDVASDKVAKPKSAPPPPAVAGARRSNTTVQGESNVLKKERSDDEMANKQASAATATEHKQDGKAEDSRALRKVSGKTFTQRTNAWYDQAYKNQSTVNIRRGTNEYRNLDAGLRSIGDTLSGTVFVVWKSKAYKIQ